MSSYKRLTVAQLRELCEHRDIYCSGLRKPELNFILCEYDAHIDVETVDDVDDVREGKVTGMMKCSTRVWTVPTATLAMS